ncbi:IclR family transcriptional regulator domain-containing protein [Novosphingobium kaempferiae]|uniref:IclR family transcriptional regulator domain-containing protein n=1 Tax=Novosphingobium kaempferiae TaxID=2896849 RepID=UPI001E34C021|nr:IclR family transcriptional regulator C-terminal domain-containing protein [Novosphingobium kaempferiae]
MSGSDPDFMQSLARGLHVLEAFRELGSGQSIASLSGHTGLPRGVVVRCLHTLTELGYVGRRDRQFHVLPAVLRLADAYLSDRSLSALAQPILEGLRDEVEESCSLAVLEGAEILYVARASRSRIMSIGLHVGSRLPAWCTSMGRVLLAAKAPEERDGLIPGDPLPRLTSNTVPDRAALEGVLQGVLRDGYSIVDQELEIGLRSIAVPVKDETGVTVAALNVGTNALERSLDELRQDVLPPLVRAAAGLGRQVASAR